MSTSIIDGTVEEAVAGRNRKGTTVYKSIRFKLDDGASRTITKAVVKDDVAAALVPGSNGRFYLFNAFDIRGIHGVRTREGRAVYDFPDSNQKIFVLVIVINLVWIALKLAVDGEIPLLGVALTILGVVGVYFMGKGRTEAKAQFDGDSGLPSSPAAPPL